MTNSAVLVLNRHYQPIHVTNVRRAFSLLYLGVARVVDPEFKTFDFATWAQLSRSYDARRLIEIIFTTGGYSMTALAINSFGIQVEPGFPAMPKPN